MRRRQMNVRVDPDLRDAFKKRCKELGLSTCHIIEAFMRGWLESEKRSSATNVDNCYTINVNAPRVVKRVRRQTIEHVPETNRYVCPPGIWIFDDEVPEGEVWVEQPPEWDGGAKGFHYDEWMKLWRRRR